MMLRHAGAECLGSAIRLAGVPASLTRAVAEAAAAAASFCWAQDNLASIGTSHSCAVAQAGSSTQTRQQHHYHQPHQQLAWHTSSTAAHWMPTPQEHPWQHRQRQRQRQQQRGMSAWSAASAADRHSTTILCIRKGAEVVIMGDGQATQGDFVVKPNVKKVRRIGSSAVGGFAGVAVDGLSLLERLEAKLEEHPGQLQRAAVELAKMWRQDKLMRELDASLVVADATTTLWLMGNGDVLEAETDGVIGIGSGADFAESAARALLQLQRDLQQDSQQQEVEADSSSSSSSDSGADEAASTPVGGASESHGNDAGGAGGADTAAAAASAEGSKQQQEVVVVVSPADMSLFDIAHAAMTIAANCCIYTNTNFSWHHIKLDGSIESGDTASKAAGQLKAAAVAQGGS